MRVIKPVRSVSPKSQDGARSSMNLRDVDSDLGVIDNVCSSFSEEPSPKYQDADLKQLLVKASSLGRVDRAGVEKEGMEKAGLERRGTDSVSNPTRRNKKSPVSKSSKNKNFRANNAQPESHFIPDMELGLTADQQTDIDHGSDDEHDQVYMRAIHILSLREHARSELRDKLARKFPNFYALDDVLDQLQESRYLCDRRYAETYVRQRSQRGYGPVKIRHDLSKKRINNNLIEEFLDLGSDYWISLARSQYYKKFGIEDVSQYKDWAKRARFLQGRGYTMQQIDSVIPRP